MVVLCKDLEASLAASVAREKENMDQVAALQEDKDKLAREIASYISKDKDMVCTCKYFISLIFRPSGVIGFACRGK